MLREALTFHNRGQLAEAAGLYRKILDSDPSSADALHLLGVIELQNHDAENGLALMERAMALRPVDPDILSNRGLALFALQRLAEALESYDRGLAIRPRDPKSLNNRGNALRGLDRREEAIASYDSALAMAPDFTDAFVNKANTLQDLNRFLEALACYDRALAIDPNHVAAHHWRGNALHNMSRFREALASYDLSLSLNPDLADARASRAFTRLLLGDFTGGWQDYLYRASVRQMRPAPPALPLPADLRGSRVLVLREQGLGDELFYLRFASPLKARGATILTLASESIAGMILRSGAADHVFSNDETPSGISLTVQSGDLPFLLGMTSDADIPPPLALSPLPDAHAAMAKRLAALGPPPYIGVTWRTFGKEVPRQELASALAHVPGTLLALQHLPEQGEVENFAREAGRPVHDFSALNESLEHMLALLSIIDEYVCVSNTNVLLRAGIRKTSRVLVSSPADFHWMAQGQQSPWFPGTTLYRQDQSGEWGRALAALKADL
jgi:tetratricopeptide (TPR) repeat protein